MVVVYGGVKAAPHVWIVLCLFPVFVLIFLVLVILVINPKEKINSLIKLYI